MRKLIHVMAAAAVITPTALLAAQVADASPMTTPVMPQPIQPMQPGGGGMQGGFGGSPGTTDYGPRYPQQAPVQQYTPPAREPQWTPPSHASVPDDEGSSVTPRRGTQTRPTQQTQPAWTPPAHTPEQQPEQQGPTVTTHAPTTPAGPTSEFTPPEGTPKFTPPSHPENTPTEGPNGLPIPHSGTTQTEGPNGLPIPHGQQPGGSPSPSAPPNLVGDTHPAPRFIPQPQPLAAPQHAVEAAQHATPVVISDPARPPAPPPQIHTTFDTTFNNVVVNKMQVRGDDSPVERERKIVDYQPNRWNWVDYDDFHHPRFYNPCRHDVWVRYFYGGAFQNLFVPMGGNVVLAIDDPVVYPYTVVSDGDDGFVATGSFDGGGYSPPVYQDVAVYLPNYDQTVTVNRVTYVGHDDARPLGQQDSFMLDDSTLAWGTKTDDEHVAVTRTQSAPGVGPTDDGGSIALAVKKTPATTDVWPYVIGAVVVAAAAAGTTLWIVRRPRGGPVTEEPADRPEQLPARFMGR